MLDPGEGAFDSLNPEQRLSFIEAEERVLREVRGNEKDVREANERSFAKIAAIGVSVVVGVVALGYLAEGKLPAIAPPTAYVKTDSAAIVLRPFQFLWRPTDFCPILSKRTIFANALYTYVISANA